MLQFDNRWRFDSPGPIEQGVKANFLDLINRVCTQGNRYSILEHFKSHFCSAAGIPYHRSTSESWAASDLESRIEDAGVNAAVFIEAFYDACEKLKARDADIAVPDINRINRILFDNGSPYQIDPPNLISTQSAVQINLPEQLPSLDSQVQKIIDSSLNNSERALSEGNGRQAVQEILWLLETVSTAFRGNEILDGSIQGKYFNKIIAELRQLGKGSHQEQVLSWMMTLHGYLSSPTGGGIRHGVDLKKGVALEIEEARLYCNLTRSYIIYLLAEHKRLSEVTT